MAEDTLGPAAMAGDRIREYTAGEPRRPLRRYRDPVPLVHGFANYWTGCVRSLYGHASRCRLQHEKSHAGSLSQGIRLAGARVACNAVGLACNPNTSTAGCTIFC